MRLPSGIIVAALAVAVTSGCVERRIVVKSDPPAAHVYFEGKEMGKNLSLCLMFYILSLTPH